MIDRMPFPEFDAEKVRILPHDPMQITDRASVESLAARYTLPELASWVATSAKQMEEIRVRLARVIQEAVYVGNGGIREM